MWHDVHLISLPLFSLKFEHKKTISKKRSEIDLFSLFYAYEVSCRIRDGEYPFFKNEDSPRDQVAIELVPPHRNSFCLSDNKRWILLCKLKYTPLFGKVNAICESKLNFFIQLVVVINYF